MSRSQWTASRVTRKVSALSICAMSPYISISFLAVQKVRGLHVSCNTDDDCKRSEVRWFYIIRVALKMTNGHYLGLHVLEVWSSAGVCKVRQCLSVILNNDIFINRKLRSRIATEADTPEKHQFCIDAWIIYKNHLESLDEPRTGGGLRSRNFEAGKWHF